MKKLNLAFLLLIVAAAVNYAQAVRINPKKIVYTRTQKDLADYKKTFEIIYPVVAGKMSATSKNNLTNSVSYWRVFATTLRESHESGWLYKMSYIVNYNKNGILDIALTQEGSGAYPDEQTVDLVIDLKTGKQVKFGEVFKFDSLAKFAAMINTRLDNEKKEIVATIGKDTSEDDNEGNNWAKEEISQLTFTAENFGEYSIEDKGLTIIYDAGFPHAIKALQPNGRYFFTWAELKPYIKPNGLLGKFIR